MRTARATQGAEIVRLGKALVEARQVFEMASMQFETAIVRYELLPDPEPWTNPVNQNTGIYAQHKEHTKQQLLGALRTYQGNLVRVAKALGVHRRQIYRLCKRFDIDIRNFRERSSNENDS